MSTISRVTGKLRHVPIDIVKYQRRERIGTSCDDQDRISEIVEDMIDGFWVDGLPILLGLGESTVNFRHLDL